MSKDLGYTVVSIYRLKGRDYDTIDIVGGTHQQREPAENHKAFLDGMKRGGGLRDDGQEYRLAKLVEEEE